MSLFIVVGKSIDMTFSKTSFFVAILAVIILNGCSTSWFENNNQDNSLKAFYPIQQMSTFEMMSDPETFYSSESETADASVYEKEDSRRGEQMANLELPNNAIDLFPASIAGVWNLSIGGKFCRIATPQTKFGQGYRAAPLHCPRIISRINSWAIKGKKLYFYDNSGRVAVALYSSNINRFEGRTFDNQLVVLSR